MVRRDVDSASFGSDGLQSASSGEGSGVIADSPVLGFSRSNSSSVSASEARKHTASRGSIEIPVGNFVDHNHHLTETNVGELFRYVWSRVESKRMTDVVLNMSGVDYIHSRFREELDFLRRHGRSRSIRITVSS